MQHSQESGDDGAAAVKFIRPSGLIPSFPEAATCPPVASPFGSSTRYDGIARPNDRYGGFHGGMDLSLSTGTPLVAIAAGAIIHAGIGGQAEGIYLWLQCAPKDSGLPLGIYAKYQHLTELPRHAVGTRVEAGQVVGLSGKTGTAGRHYGKAGYPHLHLTTFAGPSERYEIEDSRVRAEASRIIDPVAIYMPKLENINEIGRLPDDCKTVPIPYSTDIVLKTGPFTLRGAGSSGRSDAYRSNGRTESSSCFSLLSPSETTHPCANYIWCYSVDALNNFTGGTCMDRIQYGSRRFSQETGNKKNMSLLPAVCVFIALMCLPGFAAAGTGAIHDDVPSVIDPNARYLFYLHGLAIERGGRHAREYNYHGILRELAARGFVVIGEERSPVDNRLYAKKIAGQVKKLLAAGVPAMNITVAGHSKGGMITLIVMTMLDEQDIAYVNFAGCGREGGSHSGGIERFAEEEASKARGRFLSAYERGDTTSGSCKSVMEKMTGAIVKERVLDVGGGHELFYRPDKDWIDILQAWAERRDQ